MTANGRNLPVHLWIYGPQLKTDIPNPLQEIQDILRMKYTFIAVLIAHANLLPNSFIDAWMPSKCT